MRIAFNPSTVAALTSPPNNKDITFDLRGQNIFARGVKFYGTDTNTWRDIKINNVSIGSNTLDLRNGSNTTLTNTNGVVTINSTWRPVVDNLTSDSTTSSLSANQGRVLAGLINGKSDSDHNHDDRYLKLTGGTMSGTIYRNSGGTTIRGRDHAIIRQTYAPGGSSWNPIACVDTETGTWTLGHLSNGDSDTRFSFCFSTNVDYNAGYNQGNYVHIRNIDGTLALTSEIPNKNSWNYDDRYYTKAESDIKYITDITTSVNKLTFTKNGSNIARDITVNNVQSQGQLPNIADQDSTTKADSGLYIYDSYSQTIGTNFYSSVLSINTGGTIQIAGDWGDDHARNLYWRSQSDRNVADYPWKSWRTILDNENYSSTLDSRYYTETEVNSLLDAKLNRQNLSYGTWNPRIYNLAADYSYNGGDLSISEFGGQIHVSVDGYFWQNEGRYRVLDTSDVAGLKGDLTVHQDLSNTNTTWWPLIWGGSSHANTSDSTGAVYKSHDVLSWQTSSQTLYATHLRTTFIDLENNRGISRVTSGGTSPFKGLQLPDLQSNGIGIFSKEGDGAGADEGGVIISADTSVIYNSFDTGWGLTIRNKDKDQMNISGNNTIAFGVRQDYRAYSLGGFEKAGSDNSYVLLGGGDHKLESALNVSNADMVDGVHVNQLCRVYTFNVHNEIIKVGTLTSGQSGHVCKLRFNSGTGYNALNQDKAMTVVIRASDGNANSYGFYFEAHSESYRGGVFTTFYLHQTSKTQCELYMAAFNYSGQSTYEVSFSAGDLWVNEISHQNALPTSSIFTLPNYQIAYSDYNIASATKLATARKIWGQSFDGTANVDNTLRIRHTTGNYCEGIRIQTGDGALSTIILGATADSGTNTNAWSIHRKSDNNFAISRNSSDGVNGLVMTSTGMGLGTTTPTQRLDVNGNIRTTGNLYISHATDNNMNYNTSNPRIVFSESGTQAVGLVYTDYDSYRHSKGLKVMDVDNIDTSNVWFEVQGYNYSSGYVKNGSNDNYILLGGGGHKSFGGDNSNPIFLGYLNLYHGNDGTISSSFSCLGYSVPFTYTRGGNYCRIYIPDTTHQVFYIGAATASVHYSGGGMDTWTGVHRGSGAWWLHCYAAGTNEVRVKGFCQRNNNNDSWWGGNPLWSGNDGANKITVCIFGYVKFR